MKQVLRISLAFATFAAVVAGGHAAAADAPGFDCTKVHANTLKTICASPKLSGLDAELTSVYGNMRGQPSIDQKTLAKDENDWMHAVRDKCVDAKCIEGAYTARIAVLKDRSLNAASPAAYDETKPFPAPAALLSEALSYIGKSCNGIWSSQPGFMPGFSAPKGFMPVTTSSGTVYAIEKLGTRFAFLAKVGEGSCRFEDVAVLPSAAQANAFLQCSFGDPPNISSGIGLRKAGVKKLVGYWEIDGERGKLVRQPLGVLGVENGVRCQEPETGD